MKFKLIKIVLIIVLLINNLSTASVLAKNTTYNWEEAKSQSLGYIEEKTPFIKLEKDGYYYGYINKGDTIYVTPLSNNPSFTISDLKNNYLFLYKGKKSLLSPEYVNKFKLFSKEELSGTFSELNNQYTMEQIGYLHGYFNKGIKSDWKDTLLQIKNKTVELTNGISSEEEKIKKIYDWIISNIKYDEYSSFFSGKTKETYDEYLKKVNYEIFTPFGTFDNKNGVCQGISYLLYFMTEFAGIKGSKIETGGYFGQKYANHQWNKIGDYYFDATLDLNSNKYLYYKLPKELTFSTRELTSWSDAMSKLGKDYLSVRISNLQNIYNNYPSWNYQLLEPFRYLTNGKLDFNKMESFYGKILQVDNYGKFIDYYGNENKLTKVIIYPVNETNYLQFFNTVNHNKIALIYYKNKYSILSVDSSRFEKTFQKYNILNNYDNLSILNTIYSLPEEEFKPFIAKEDIKENTEIKSQNKNNTVNELKNQDVIINSEALNNEEKNKVGIVKDKIINILNKKSNPNKEYKKNQIILLIKKIEIKLQNLQGKKKLLFLELKNQLNNYINNLK